MLKALPYDPSAFRGMVMPEESATTCARLICTICLLDNDPDLIEPDVLARDRGKELTQVVIDRHTARASWLEHRVRHRNGAPCEKTASRIDVDK